MGSTSLKLALLLVLCLWTSAILAAPTTTIKPIDEVHTEKSTKNELAKPALAPESRSNVDNLSEEDLDGRSAYINNRYVADEDMDEDIEQNQPLYEILQKQMEHVLAATGPDVPHYGIESGDDNTSDELKHDSLQRPPNKPIFELQNEEEDVDDYPEDEQEGEDIDGQETASQEESEETAPTQSTTTSTNKPKTTKRKHTVIIMRSTKTPHRVKTTSTTPATTTKSATATTTTTTTTTTELPTTTTSSTSTTTTERPMTTSSTTSTPPPTTTTTTTTHKPKQQPVMPPNSIYPINTDVYNHKRRIIFKTISTGSQFVNSPIGDLMIKFSIGFAKPPAAQLAARSSATVNEALKTLSGNLIKQLNANALHKKHKRVKKSQNGEKIH